jgi:hypothetical protein
MSFTYVPLDNQCCQKLLDIGSDPQVNNRLSKWLLAGWIINYPSNCGLVARLLGYRSNGPGFDSRRYQISCEVVGLERGAT